MLFAWYCVVIKLNIKKASVIWVKYTCLPNNLLGFKSNKADYISSEIYFIKVNVEKNKVRNLWD